MSKLIDARTRQLQKELMDVGAKLDAGDDSRILVWVIPGLLACSHRPLRRHPYFGGPQRDLPPEAGPLIVEWIRRVKGDGVQSVISMMGRREHRHYDLSAVGAADLLDLYHMEGLQVRSVPWEDPKYTGSTPRPSYGEQLLQIRGQALIAFDQLQKPVLLHCSSGIDRSSPVAAFIASQRRVSSAVLD